MTNLIFPGSIDLMKRMLARCLAPSFLSHVAIVAQHVTYNTARIRLYFEHTVGRVVYKKCAPKARFWCLRTV